ncbi:unnamed protein product, partial [Didymodactylos carnosus]
VVSLLMYGSNYLHQDMARDYTQTMSPPTRGADRED